MLQLICFTSCFATSFEVPQRNLYVPTGMNGQVRLIRDDNHTFKAIVDGQAECEIKNYNVRGLQKNISNEALKKADCYFRLSQVSENAILEINGRLRGGEGDGWLSKIWKGIKWFVREYGKKAGNTP